MRILQICHKVPFPVVDGGTAAMHQISEGLSDLDNDIKIVAIKTHKQDFSEAQLSNPYKEKFRPEYIFINTKINFLDALLNLFSNESYNVSRFDKHEIHVRIASFLKKEKFDVIILDSLFVCPYIATIRENSDAKIILRAHNVEHKIWERKWFNESNPLKKYYLKLLASRLKKYEEKTIPLVDGVAAISLEDFNYFKNNFSLPVEFIPLGFSNFPTSQHELFLNKKGYFLGTMDWEPNLQAANWLIENLYKELKSLSDEFNLTIAGNKMPEKYFQFSDENFFVKGKVQDASDFIKGYGVMVAPLFSGGGLKIKIVEAMAHGKIVLTTDLGSEGIGIIPDKHFLLCNKKEEFIKAIKFCVTNKQKAHEIALAGQKFIQENYNINDIMKRLNNFISYQCLAN